METVNVGCPSLCLKCRVCLVVTCKKSGHPKPVTNVDTSKSMIVYLSLSPYNTFLYFITERWFSFMAHVYEKGE